MGIWNQLYLNVPALKVNPVTALAGGLGLAYLPAALRLYYVNNQLAKKRSGLNVAESRQQISSLVDDSPDGKQIAFCTGCHVNGLEAFGCFSAAILSAMALKVNKSIVEGAAASFLVIRSLYTVVYLSPSLNGPLRTVLFALGEWVCVDLLLTASTYW